MKDSDVLKVRDKVEQTIARGRKPADVFNPKGKYKVEIIRAGKVIQTLEGDNTVVNDGKNKILNVMFQAATQITAWYIGLLDGTGTIDAADTMSSHAGWTENDSYDEATRPAWSVSASSAQSISNGTPQTFTMNATETIKGIFITSVNTKNGTTGTLWAAALFSSAASVNSGDEIKVTYTVTD